MGLMSQTACPMCSGPLQDGPAGRECADPVCAWSVTESHDGHAETSRDARVAHVLLVLARNGAMCRTEPPMTAEQWSQWATPLAEDIVSEPRFWRDYADSG